MLKLAKPEVSSEDGKVWEKSPTLMIIKPQVKPGANPDRG